MKYKDLEKIATLIAGLEEQCQNTNDQKEIEMLINEIAKEASDVQQFEDLFILDELIQEKLKKVLT